MTKKEAYAKLDTEDFFAKLARSEPRHEIPPPTQEWLDANEREADFNFFAYHLEMSRADFDVLAQTPHHMSDLAHEIQAFEHHECCEECPVECPAALPLGPGEYKAYLKWCDEQAAKAMANTALDAILSVLDAEDAEWQAFKAEHTEATELAKKNWDAAQLIAKVEYRHILRPAFPQCGKGARPEPIAEPLSHPADPLAPPDGPKD
jgi:hypothetical protein